ncbi:TraX family protein [Microcoleus sp. FACHB-1515]|nr:TraX family protein [Microcoleus sp. FACHB-1515]
MVIDHIGAVFFPEVLELRMLGRLSFPLFCWLLVQGEAHTKNFQQYAIRLLILGIVSQPIYQLIFQVQRLNIFLTLLIGLGCLRAARQAPQFQVLSWVGGGLLAEASSAEYGAYGIGAIALLKYFQPDKIWWWAGWILLHLILLIAQPNFGQLQLFAVAAPLILQMVNHQPGAKARWFYLFYPVHLLVLYLIRIGLTRISVLG